MDSDSDTDYVYSGKYVTESSVSREENHDAEAHSSSGGSSKAKKSHSRGLSLGRGDRSRHERLPLPSIDTEDGLEDASINPTIWARMERVFEVKKRGTTFRAEAMLGLVQFISCLYVLPVVPEQMHDAGYDAKEAIVATAATCCIGCILGAFITNTPFIIAPPTSVSIFLVVYLKQQNLTKHDGNVATILSGILLIAVGFIRPLSNFISRLIPDCIQASTAVGIGLITALAGATEVHLVVRGEHTILDMGDLSPEVIICMGSLVVIAVFMYYHIKGAFCVGLLFGSILYWLFEGGWPSSFMAAPKGGGDTFDGNPSSAVVMLLFDLLFLYILVLNGIARSLSDLSKLTLPDGKIPRGRWLLVVCGITTVISGHMSGPPILISPESAAGVKAGAKTGFSTLVCGMCFGVSAFFAPFFADIPAAGTAPLLIMVGVLLFQNAKRIDWYQPNYAVPAFCCVFFIPFTYSILRGVAFAYATYVLIGIFTGDFWIESVTFIRDYLAPLLNKNDYAPAPTLLGTMEFRTVWSNPVAFFWNILNSEFMNTIDGGIAPMDINGEILAHDDSKTQEIRDLSKTKLIQANEMFTELTNINVARDFNPFNSLGISRRGSFRVPPPSEEDLSMRSPPEDINSSSDNSSINSNPISSSGDKSAEEKV